MVLGTSEAAADASVRLLPGTINTALLNSRKESAWRSCCILKDWN